MDEIDKKLAGLFKSSGLHKAPEGFTERLMESLVYEPQYVQIKDTKNIVAGLKKRIGFVLIIALIVVIAFIISESSFVSFDLPQKFGLIYFKSLIVFIIKSLKIISTPMAIAGIGALSGLYVLDFVFQSKYRLS